MADAALAAFRLSGDEEYLAVFRRAYAWFHGHNSLGKPLADVSTGACCDGLTPSGVNQNQGAESTLAYLWTELCSREFAAVRRWGTPTPTSTQAAPQIARRNE